MQKVHYSIHVKFGGGGWRHWRWLCIGVVNGQNSVFEVTMVCETKVKCFSFNGLW
jgi:hypothetical protein